MASMEMSSPETPNSRTKIAMERPAIIGKRKTMPERQSAISKKKAMVEKNFGQPKRRPSMDKPNTKGRAGPSLHSVRSLSGDYRFTGGSLLVEKEEAVNLTIVEEEKDGIDVGGKSEMSNLQSYMEEEGVNVCALAEEDFVGFKVNNESPYSSISTDTDERPLPGDESSLDSSASWWPRNFLSQTNSRWSDTSSYGAKKILISGSLESFDVDDLCFNAHYSGVHEQGCDVYNHLSYSFVLLIMTSFF